MGGLDARYLASQLGCSERVASVTTIATPHWGSPVADWVDRQELLMRAIRHTGRLAGLETGAVNQLTTAQMAQFNTRVPGRLS